ncbi:MAG: D-alanyl-D-alanine carboxypeptidase, partial [Paludibacteraceae bacterium]|nr:D-alanyl-D-alanine carboxypeptidase [Paludibacteraceae bacterium]
AIFRYLGTRYSLPGSIHNSQDLLRDYWRRRGVSVQNAIIKDGCGLAPQDAVSAKAFVQLLMIMSRSKNADAWLATLPVSGQTGTLKSLCAKTELEGRIHAKSGTIAGTKNFAGYIDMPNGDRWVFAILINSAPGKARNIQTVIQQYLLDVYNAHQ